MIYLILGSEGFIGKALSAELEKEKGSFLIKADSVLPKSNAKNVSCEKIDITQTGPLLKLCENESPDIVFNLAGLNYSDSPEEMLKINCAAPAAFLEASFGQKYRIVLIGSAAEYGNVPSGTRIKEDSALCPISAYGKSKVCQTTALQRLSGKNDCPEIILARPFNIIGPGVNERLFLGAFASQVAKIEKGLQEPVIKVGNMEHYRDLLPIDKVVFCLRALAKSGLHGEAYNICSGKPILIGEILKKLLCFLKIDIKVVTDQARIIQSDIKWSVGDNKKLSELIKPDALDYDLDKVLEETLAWYRAKLIADRRK